MGKYQDLYEGLMNKGELLSEKNVQQTVDIGDGHSEALYAVTQLREGLKRYLGKKGKFAKNPDKIKNQIKMLGAMKKTLNSTDFKGKVKADKEYMKEPIKMWLRR